MNLSKYLPSSELHADFEKYRKMSPEERIRFQEERAQRYEASDSYEQATFRANTKQGLFAIKEELQDINLLLESENIGHTG